MTRADKSKAARVRAARGVRSPAPDSVVRAAGRIAAVNAATEPALDGAPNQRRAGERWSG